MCQDNMDGQNKNRIILPINLNKNSKFQRLFLLFFKCQPLIVYQILLLALFYFLLIYTFLVFDQYLIEVKLKITSYSMFLLVVPEIGI